MADPANTRPEARKRLKPLFGGGRNVRRPGPVLALDLDREVLRAAHCAPRGSGTAVTGVALAHLPLKPDADRTDPVVMGNALAAALDTLRLKSAQVVMGVPRQLVVLRTLFLPQIHDVRELASVVHLQIGKDLPFRLEEAVIDFKVRQPMERPARAEAAVPPASAETADGPSPSAPPAQMEVLVAAIRRDTLDYYLKTAATAKLKLVALGWHSQANARCLEACAAAEPTEVVALISLRPEEVGFDVVAQGALLFSRGASIRLETESGKTESAEPPAAEEQPPEVAAAPKPANYVEAATIEVVRSLHSYGGMEGLAPVSKLVLSGATGQEQLLAESLQKRLQVPCEILNPAQALDLPKDAHEHAADALGAIGLGLGVNDPEGLPFDFLHPKRPAVQRNMRRIWTLALCAAGAALAIGVLGVRAHLVKQHLKIKSAVETELKKEEKKVPIYRRMQQQAANLQKWTSDGRNWLDHLAYLSAVLPSSEELYVTSLSIGGQGNIHLAVQARSGEILASLEKRLRAAGYEVKPLAITPGNDKFGYNFRSTVELIVPPRMQIDLSKAQPPARPADDASLEGKSRSGRKGGRS